MQDFNEVELAVGDKVIYGSGYSCLKEGVIVNINEDKGFLSVRCLRNSLGAVQRTKYFHKLTGKWVDPFDHEVSPAGYYNRVTGAKLTTKNLAHNLYNLGYDPSGTGIPNPDFVPSELREWRGTVFSDDIAEVTLEGGSVSVLRNSRGVMKL